MITTPYFMEGFMLALNALPDVYAVVDSPRCEKQRADKIGYWADLYSDLAGDGTYSRNRRLYTADWESCADILGAERELIRVLQIVADRHPGKRILVLRMFITLLIHSDTEGLTRAMESKINNPLMFIRQASLDDDWVVGYRQVNQAIREAILQDKGSDQPLISGYGFMRNEGDEVGNVLEIERLWRALKLPKPRWPFNGRPLSFEPISKRAPRVVFPYDFEFDEAHPKPGVLRLNPPIGIEATSSFVRALAEHFGCPRRAEKLIEKETRRVAERLVPAVSRKFGGCGAVVVDEPWRAHGLAGLLRELGMGVPLAILLKRNSVPADVQEGLAAQGTEVWADPSFHKVREYFLEAAAKGHIDFVIGSGVFRDLAKAAGLCYVECGFPSYLQHFLSPTPIMGYEGAVRLAERIYNALAERDYASRV